VIKRAVGFFDDRLGVAPGARKLLRYVFPDHWSFLLGEIALYSFMVLVGTGVFLTFYYSPSDAETVYRGAYEPLQGLTMTESYWSTLNLSLDVPAGLLMRQTHHWAANLMIVAITLHLLRILLTGAFRRPREINYMVGVTLLAVTVLEGFAGYSLPDDLLSGMGLVIAYGVAMSIPLLGGDLSFLIWGGEFPGSAEFFPRLYIVHVLLVPVAIAGLIGAHLAMIMRQHHTQFRGKVTTERNVVGYPLWPGYALKSIGLMLITAAVLFLLGGLVQINPIWQWGPYEPYLSTNGAQPDWYLGWLLGGLRLMPALEIQLGNLTLVPNPFWGGLAFPTLVFLTMYAWPWIDRRWLGDHRRHELLDLPRDNPRRTAIVVSYFSWVLVVFVAGSVDRLYFRSTIPYEAQIWFLRIAVFVVPVIVYFATRRLCEELRDRERRPLRGWNGKVVRRTPAGGFETLELEEGVPAIGGGGNGRPGAPGEEQEVGSSASDR
jgi:ubiquinol-cytochrome c reductase cytochrome b subunit